jgi:nucleolin
MPRGKSKGAKKQKQPKGGKVGKKSQGKDQGPKKGVEKIIEQVGEKAKKVETTTATVSKSVESVHDQEEQAKKAVKQVVVEEKKETRKVEEKKEDKSSKKPYKKSKPSKYPPGTKSKAKYEKKKKVVTEEKAVETPKKVEEKKEDKGKKAPEPVKKGKEEPKKGKTSKKKESSSESGSSSGSGSESGSSSGSSSGSKSSSSNSYYSSSSASSSSGSYYSESSSEEADKKKAKDKKEEKKEVKETETPAKESNKRKRPDETAEATKKQKTESNGNASADTRVQIDNLDYNIQEDDVKAHFADCGDIASITWIEDPNGRFLGKGTISFVNASSVDTALAKAGSDLRGRALKVSKPPPPSATIVLSCLPADVTEEDIREVFGKFGEVAEVRLITRQRPLAFVDYVDLPTAIKAMSQATADGGAKIKGSKVNLDYAMAPGSRQNTPRQDNQRGRFDGGGRGGRNAGPGRQSFGGGGGAKTPKPEGGRTLFCGGLPDSIEESDIRGAFEGCSVADIRWVERDGQFKGVAFVEFSDTHTADQAMSIGQRGVNVKGRNMRIDWASDKRR